MTSKIFSLAIVVATLLLASTIPPSSATWFHRESYHVHIINELSRNEVLTVDCNCADGAQPTGYVKVGTEYEWWFKEHAFRSTHWSCNLFDPANNRHVWFVAFYDGMISAGNDVYWVVKEDGVYSRYENDELESQWKTGPKRSAIRVLI